MHWKQHCLILSPDCKIWYSVCQRLSSLTLVSTSLVPSFVLKSAAQVPFVIMVNESVAFCSSYLFFHHEKTCPCNEYSLNPNFTCIEKQVLARIYLFFLFSIQNMLWVILRTTSPNMYPQSMFRAKTRKKKFKITQLKIAIRKMCILYEHVFVTHC